MKKFVYILILAMLLSLCGCGASGSAPAEEADTPESDAATEENPAPGEKKPDEKPEPDKTPEPEPVPEKPELTVHGTYNLYSVKYAGAEYKPSEMSVASTLSLNEDGTGSMTVNDEETVITEWKNDNGKITMYNQLGNALECTLLDGIITLEMGEDYYWYLAHEDTGLTDPDAGKQFESMLYAVYKGIDGNAGSHLNYEYHLDYMDSTSRFDVHAKDGVFYSDKDVKVGGVGQHSATFFKDGTVYVLYPDKMTGNAAAETNSGAISGNVLMLDDLYKLIFVMAQRSDYTVETRELDGVSYRAEVFPATDLRPEAVFCFDGAGALKHVIDGAPKLMPEMGETFYTVHSVDTAVNESLLDISGYTITE